MKIQKKKSHLEHVGLNVKSRRVLLDMTQEELCYKSAVSLPTLRDIEKGRANFEIQTMQRIAYALGWEVKIGFMSHDFKVPVPTKK